MFILKAEKRIESYLGILKDRQFSTLSYLKDFKKAVCPNFKYNRLPSESLNWEYINTPDFYGSDNTDVWYQSYIDVPDEDQLFLKIELQTDSLVIINENEKFFAINPFHNLVPLSEFKNKRIKFSICIWSGYKFPGYHPKEKGRVLVTVAKREKDYPLVFNTIEIVKKNINNYNLYYDVYVLYQLSKTLSNTSLLYQQIISKLHSALMNIKSFSNDIDINEADAKAVIEIIKPLLEYKNGSVSPQIYSIGSAHLDYAWLWPTRETIRKAARTLSEMNYLMNYDSSFKFMFSQPIVIEKVKEIYPEIFNELFKHYEKGQFEPNGVGFVEPDCMLSSGEGLIRNILFGRKITEKLFPNYYGDTFYVPDSFGYMATLPQILKKSGIKYIVTSKLGWNDTTKHPFDIFDWKGLDGSIVKAHMIQGAYEGTQDPVENYEMFNQIDNKDVQNSLLRPIGEGDGGGGTTLEDLELIKRQSNLQGLPKNKWQTMSKALDKIFENEVPVYEGELYLELHRGTYTTQAKTKKYHRTLEKKLHNTEYLVAYFYTQNYIQLDKVKYYKEKIDECWNLFLINQFHDILPGSTVRVVNEEAHSEYEKATMILDDILDELITKGDFLLNLTPYDQNGIEPYESDCVSNRKKRKAKVGKQVFDWGSIYISENGQITSFVVNDREIAFDDFNQIKFGEDYPNYWDAWDIEEDNLSRLKVQNTIFEDGKVITTFDNGSTLVQEIVIYEDVARLDFVTKVNWMENHKILRATFNHNINSSFTNCDIPFGFFSRTNDKNLLNERAKFETPAHQYICQGDNENIIGLLTDSKFGYSFEKNQLSVSLLRSSKAPDEVADMHNHKFTYSIVVTNNDIKNVIKEAENLNNNLISCDKEINNNLFKIKNDNIILETLKISEDNESLIFRFREAYGIKTEATIDFNKELLDSKSLTFTNLIEEEIEDNFNFNPFELKTIKISRL